MQRVLEPEVMDTAEEADEYDAMDHTEPNRGFVARLVELGAGGSMLDVGCGPGHVAVMVCDEIAEGSVLGVDLAQTMLTHAERHRSKSPHAERLSFRLADAKGLPFADGEFDTVYSNTILHHIPDPRPFLSELRRVLKPGGVLLVRDLFRPDDIERADELVALHAAGANPNQQALFHASLCAAFTPNELRALADESGLADAEIVVDTDRHMSLQLRRGA
ncbi:class I SAM-dependent methyltransferase [Engelhardtia mirabilis]|uniref:Demethylrebeccamycin-D-glucose O-methyltransferase n=1 Tax=Engelhardtia mirabilis TaxID=2528011 RepID=A0A518BQY6_9BACT|nr:Demethylrebeccamycin-D-glucose O-methyltransferase [Planctomycetes bacterium Pla133]QDV03718.1 Demethylrebeccamycin-D-glucose O-methyltransferase [Planctomycetes bacterium Pla86]